LTKGTNEIILDAYNANPSSMAVAIANFLQLDKPNKIMILGDMFELGEESLSEHKSLIDSLLKQDSVSCFFVGLAFYANKTEKRHFSFYETFDTFSNAIKMIKVENSCILIKGSRGMALERTLDFL
jgi:UDP-N-acetylmuramoyl-tripeptide--D-alanyl-D-alanine ligase